MKQEIDSSEHEVKQTSKTLLPWEAAHSLSADMVICFKSYKKKCKTSALESRRKRKLCKLSMLENMQANIHKQNQPNKYCITLNLKTLQCKDGISNIYFNALSTRINMIINYPIVSAKITASQKHQSEIRVKCGAFMPIHLNLSST